MYRALGFVEVDTEQISDGIRYISMSYNQKNKTTKN
ncbi:MAG: GNAT family N-acetyltransferase [Prevotella sp.]